MRSYLGSSHLHATDVLRKAQWLHDRNSSVICGRHKAGRQHSFECGQCGVEKELRSFVQYQTE